MASLRLADLEKNERQKAQSVAAVDGGKMSFGDALAVFQSRMQVNPALKPKTKEYCDCQSGMWIASSRHPFLQRVYHIV